MVKWGLGIFGLLGALFYLFWGHYGGQNEGDYGVNGKAFMSDVIVHVGEATIYREDLEWAYQFHLLGLDDKENLTSIPSLGDSGSEILNPLKDKLVAGLIERKLLFEAIKASEKMNLARPELYTECMSEWRDVLASLSEKEALVRGKKNRDRLKERVCEWSIIRQYLTKNVYSKVVVEDGEVAAYFQNHEAQFRKGPRVIIRQMLFASEREASKVRNRAKSYNFADLARKHSIAPEAGEGGLLGPFAKGEMPRIFNVAFSMRVGEISGVLKSTYGFHIIKLEKKLPRRQPDLASVEGEIRRRLRKQKEEGEYQKWLESALSTVSVKTPKPLW